MEKSGHSGLKLTIVAAILAFSLIPLFGLGLFFHIQFTEAFEEKITRTLRIMVEDKRNVVDMFLNENVNQLRNIAYTHTYKEMSDSDYLAEVYQVLAATSNAFVDLGVFDASGEHVAYTGPYKLSGLNYADQEWFQNVMTKGRYVSDVFLGHRRFPHIIMAVKRQEGVQTWILRATIDSEMFTDLVRGSQLGEFGDAFLVNQNMELQTQSHGAAGVMEKAVLPRQGRFPGFRMVEFVENGRQMIAGVTWLQTKNWMLVVAENPEEALSPLVGVRWRTFGIVLAGALIILTGAVLTASTMIRQLNEYDRRRAESDAALMQSSKIASLGKMAAGVAHEINNPLSLIRESAGWIQDLLTEEDPEAIKNFGEIEDSLAKIDKHVERARNVTHRLLGFARRMEPMQENVNLNALVDQTVAFLENEALHREVTVERRLDSNLPLVTTDSAQVQQVVLNLLENALDAVNSQGRIILQTGYDDREARISVQDNGCGIPKDMASKIFDPFFTTKKTGEGTGLGLSISYGIIKKMGGRISVESEPGAGSTFTIHLPLAAEE
ncbi:MAG: two-component system, NtrC family, sensor kinase [Desulfovibrionales bacterium]|nr:two-component system, NtrC family, sensor kinase [Desulfovibrionales bacterium]